MQRVFSVIFSICLLLLLQACAGSVSGVAPAYREANNGFPVWGFPACEGDDSSQWHNCTSQHSYWSKDGRKMYVSYRYEWRNGRQDGRYSEFYPDKYRCEGFFKNVDGVSKKEGKFVCKTHDGKSYEEFYADGQLSKEREFDFSLDEYQRKCEMLGFTKGTDSFAECSLRLLELDGRDTGSPQAREQEYSAIKQKNNDAERLEGLKEMLEGIQQGIDVTKPQTQRTDAACLQKCLKDGSMMSYCKSYCSY